MKRVVTLCFSPTQTTKATVETIGGTLARELALPLEAVGFTLPQERLQLHAFGEEDLVVVGLPTYAGKLPNKILPDLRERLRGGGAAAVAVVSFGNRSFDNSLAELCAVLAETGFRTVAAGAFVSRHAFTDRLATGRPNEEDREEQRLFARTVAQRLRKAMPAAPLQVPGEAEAPYYVPKGVDGAPAKFLKAAPKVDKDRCTDCGWCVKACPMGALEASGQVTGTCIKCHACIRGCPQGALYFDDPAFLSHVAMLEASFTEPKANAVFYT